MRHPTRPHQTFLFQAPYRMLIPLAGPSSLARLSDPAGAAVVWLMGSDPDRQVVRELRERPGGMPLIAVLPQADEVRRPQDLFSIVDQCRPQSLLPFHESPNPVDLRALLSRPPDDLSNAVVDYLGWRGLVLDIELRRMLRRILELSAEITTVSGLARGLYMSRRALGRRCLKEGLPVPSHWLHFGRLLRVALDLQRPGRTLMEVAFDHHYPDGFSLSNQMKRLFGIRPSEVADRLGWEWVVERWLVREMASGGFSVDQIRLLDRPKPKQERDSESVDERRPA